MSSILLTKDLKFIHVAYHSTLYVKGKSLLDLAAKNKTELHKVVKWFQINRLSLNVSKQYLALFFSASQADIRALANNGTDLVYSAATNFLGILVDNKLKFAPHIRDFSYFFMKMYYSCNAYSPSDTFEQN